MDSGILDLVGYGVGTDFFEGGGPAPTLSNTTSAQRLDGGLTDSDNNNLDFISGAPNPRNSVSPFNPPPPVMSVPEPSAFILCASGMLGLIGFAMLRRKLMPISAAS